jgi:hypothetical protein
MYVSLVSVYLEVFLGLLDFVYFCRSADKRNRGVLYLSDILYIFLERLGTEVGSFYEHCFVVYMFALLARLLPAHITFPVTIPCSLWAGIAAPELVLSNYYVL